jgi:hypothetical protein
MSLYSIANNILFFGMAIHIYMTNYYPMEYNIFLVEAAHFCVLTYSRLQIFADRLYRNLKKNPEFKSYADYFEGQIAHFFNPNVGNVEIIKDSQVFVHTTDEKLKELFYPAELMDFLIFSDKQASGQANKAIYFNVPTNFSYQKCNFKFISLTVSFSEKEHYNLKLITEKENYFIVNNRLNKYLFCYLIRKQFGIIKDETTVCYSLEIFDQNVNNVTLSEKDEIVLELENYAVRQMYSEVDVAYTATIADAKEDVPPPPIDEYIKVGDE